MDDGWWMVDEWIGGLLDGRIGGRGLGGGCHGAGVTKWNRGKVEGWNSGIWLIVISGMSRVRCPVRGAG